MLDFFLLVSKNTTFSLRLNYEYIYKLRRIFCMQVSNCRIFRRDEFLTLCKADKYLRDTINIDVGNQSVKALN